MRKMIRVFIAALIIVALMPCKHVNAASKFADSLNDKKIVHACGGFNGIRHANCEESLVEAIESGKKVIEIDFMFTSDDVLICEHGFLGYGKQVLSYDEFLRRKPMEEGTAMTAQRAISLLKNTDIKLIVDTQDPKLVKVYKELRKICKKENAEKYFKNIIPQIYYEGQYKEMEAFYKFPEYIFEAYRITGSPKKGGHADFKYFQKVCKRHKKIKYVAFYSKFVTKKAVKMFEKYNVGVIAHPVNTKSDFKRLKKMGVKAVMTDFL